jgi:hypothetical protein
METDNVVTASERPTAHTPELATKLCDRLIEGESLRAVCADPGMPTRATVERWLNEHAAFRGFYVFTRELQAEDLLVDACTAANTARSGCLERVRGGKTVILSGRAELTRARLRVHIRWWVAERLLSNATPRAK